MPSCPLGNQNEPGKFLVDDEKIFYFDGFIPHGIKTTCVSLSFLILYFFIKYTNFYFRKTFFDKIEEDIHYPPSIQLDNEFFYDVPFSISDGKIIITSYYLNFTLFCFEKNRWTESVVEFPGPQLNGTEQLVTVKNLETER